MPAQLRLDVAVRKRPVAVTTPKSHAIFLSYRREETRHLAGRIADWLSGQLGEQQIFMDVAAIDPGADFVNAIVRSIGSCYVLVALIGPSWSTTTDRTGRRRLDNAHDYVVLEIHTALDRGIRVIPALVDGATMPRRDELPTAIRDLANRNAVRIDHETFRSDMGVLLDALQRDLPALGQAPASSSTGNLEDGVLALRAAGKTDDEIVKELGMTYRELQRFDSPKRPPAQHELPPAVPPIPCPELSQPTWS